MNAQDGLHTYRRKCVLFWQKDNSDLNRDSSEISWNNSVVSVLTEDTQHTNLLSSYLSDKMKMWPNLGQIFSTIASEVWVFVCSVLVRRSSAAPVCAATVTTSQDRLRSGRLGVDTRTTLCSAQTCSVWSQKNCNK